MREVITFPIVTERHVPDFVRESKVMMAIYKAEDKALVQALWDINTLLNDGFIDTVEDPTLGLLEQWWKIPVPVNATLEDRRLAVQAKMAAKTIYTKRTLYQILVSLCGSDGFVLDVDTSNYMVKVLVELKSKNQVNVVLRMLHDILPANMLYDLQIRFNQWYMLTKFTYAELAQMTCYNLKNSTTIKEEYIRRGGVLM